MRIIKASAGSGKTYTLSHTYIDYLLKSNDPKAYRHLLAVTFTNKATAEMKARILKDLQQEARTNPLAKQYLVSILHDYSAFGVSTIDRFFQQTLRAFARELGQFSSYQVELDKDSLVAEAMDRMLDGISADQKELVDWLKSNALENIQKNGRFKLDDGLMEMGRRLKSEEYRQLKESCGIDEKVTFSKQNLADIRTHCRKIISSFESAAKALGVPKEKGKTIPWPRTKKAMADDAVRELFESRYELYATASIVDRQLYALGVAREFSEAYDALMKEKNVLPLDESSALLRDIIDGSDAPFVYEKTGSRYSHYLLDEFQDTSRLQWDNFLPLLRDADASGDNLIVGDVKQSIYRWRNSDWRMLDHEIQEEFPHAAVENPENNWRSARAVVNFNNDFFEYASGALGLSQMYSNVRQNVRSDEPQEGFVRVTFTSDQVQAVLDSIKDIQASHAQLRDIAILVRTKDSGATLASALIEAGIPVISDDTLDLKTAVTVRRLVSLLTFYENPGNTVGSYIAQSIGIQFPERYHSLVDFCEILLRELGRFDPKTFEAETLYIGAFMDRLQDWVGVNGNNLKAFLSSWDEMESCYIGSPENSDAVRIMTIHKSKGLEFPHVIFPYADKVGLYKSDTRWCELKSKGTALGETAAGIYPVSLSSSTEHNMFKDDYRLEYGMQVVDNLNLFYVALTRAVKSLHVIAKEPAQGKAKALQAGKSIEWSNFSELLYARCGCCSDFRTGKEYDFSQMKRKESSAGIPLNAAWNSFPLGDRLKASQDASDYFGEDGTTGSEASGRLRGIELHKILSAVDSVEDLPKDIGQEDYLLLKQRIEAHPEWFSATDIARNELTVFGADGSRWRPDRVVHTADGGIVVVDYKFGAERGSYLNQVRRYMQLYKDMGRANVSGYVWYVPEDKVVKV